MERVSDRQGKMEGHGSTGQSPLQAVKSVKEEEEYQLKVPQACVCVYSMYVSFQVGTEDEV